MTASENEQSNQAAEQIDQYVAENTDILTRVLTSGDTEAQAWALTLLANAESTGDIDAVREQLDELVQEGGT